MAVKTGYFGLEVSDLDAWEEYGNLFGFVSERNSSGLFFRTDNKARRFQCVEGLADDVAWVGWEVDTLQEYQDRYDQLRRDGIDVREGDASDAALRDVDHFFSFLDPNGVRFEIACGLREAAPFESHYIPGGFETGEMGVGHIAIMTQDLKASEQFLGDALGARLSDHVSQQLPDDSMLNVAFMHTGLRHHSVAYVEGPIGGASKIHHLQISVNRISDLGTTYDRIQAAGVGIGISLGQHPNDFDMSFYAETPAKFLLELGFTGIRIENEEAWEPKIFDRISLWGHSFKAPLKEGTP